MKNKLIFALAAILLLGSGGRSQAPVLYYYETIPAGGTVANCPAVAAGVTAWCKVASGEFQSINGAAWAAIATGTVTAGVTGIIVCGASGVTCGSAQTGTVTLDIPKAAQTLQ